MGSQPISFMVECWGHREGLRMLKENNFNRVVVEIDLKAVLKLMKKSEDGEDMRGIQVRE